MLYFKWFYDQIEAASSNNTKRYDLNAWDTAINIRGWRSKKMRHWNLASCALQLCGTWWRFFKHTYGLAVIVWTAARYCIYVTFSIWSRTFWINQAPAKKSLFSVLAQRWCSIYIKSFRTSRNFYAALEKIPDLKEWRTIINQLNAQQEWHFNSEFDDADYPTKWHSKWHFSLVSKKEQRKEKWSVIWIYPPTNSFPTLTESSFTFWFAIFCTCTMCAVIRKPGFSKCVSLQPVFILAFARWIQTWNTIFEC